MFLKPRGIPKMSPCSSVSFKTDTRSQTTRIPWAIARGTHLAAFFQHQFRADRRFYPGEPGLQQIVFKALSILTRNPKGFFLVIGNQALDHSCAGGSGRDAHEMLELRGAWKRGCGFPSDSRIPSWSLFLPMKPAI